MRQTQGARLGDAGARQGQVRPFPARAAAAGRHRRGGAGRARRLGRAADRRRSTRHRQERVPRVSATPDRGRQGDVHDPRADPCHPAARADPGAARVLFHRGLHAARGIIGDDWLRRLRDATDELVERSREVTESDAVFDLEPDHRADAPRLRRVSRPVEQHPVYWEYVSKSILADIGRRPGRAGRQVPPLQAQLQVGQGRRGGEVALRHLASGRTPTIRRSPSAPTSTTAAWSRGRSAVLPRSHLIEPMLTQYDDAGKWVGCLSPRDVRGSTSSRRPTWPGRPAR